MSAPRGVSAPGGVFSQEGLSAPGEGGVCSRGVCSLGGLLQGGCLL